MTKLSPAQQRCLLALARCDWSFNARTFQGKPYFVLERLGLIEIEEYGEPGCAVARITDAGRALVESTSTPIGIRYS